GAQDNGSVLGRDASGINPWRGVFGGDGGYVAVDPADPGVLYVESQHANLIGSADGGTHVGFIGAPGGDTFMFICPFTLDPNDHNQLWLAGGHRLWHLLGSGWAAASASLATNISAVTLARGTPARLLFGTTDGAIHRGNTTAATSTTQWPSTKPRDGWVSS